jgi:hypothetical protein
VKEANINRGQTATKTTEVNTPNLSGVQDWKIFEK